MPVMMSIELQGDKIVSEKLMRGAQAAANMRTPLWTIREDIFRVIKINFSSQGRRGGGSWKYLDPSTVAAKLRAGLDPRILYARHRLVNSLTQRGNPYMRSAVSNKDIYIRSTLPYAEAQNYGVEDHIPARPFMEFLHSDKKRWSEICLTHVMGAMGGV